MSRVYDNRRLALSALWVMLGAALVWLSVTEVLDSSVYAGMGGALMCVGILQVERNVRYRRDGAYRERIDIEYTDERNHYLRKEAWTRTGSIVVALEAIGAVVAMVLNNTTVQLTLASTVSVTCLVYWASWMVLSRRS